VATGRITKLPFTDLDRPYSVVVDRHGDVIISDPSDTWVLELPRL
jgi:hypothetical protein